jgi:hypothetical protein
LMDAVSVLAPDLGLVAACHAMNVNRANVYREQVVSFRQGCLS